MAAQLTSPPEPDLVRALLATKRLIPIVDHLSELAPAARAQLLAALPPGLVIVTSRSLDDGFRERPLSRITPQRIAAQRLQEFFLDYLRRKGEAGALTDNDLIAASLARRRDPDDARRMNARGRQLLDSMQALCLADGSSSIPAPPTPAPGPSRRSISRGASARLHSTPMRQKAETRPWPIGGAASTGAAAIWAPPGSGPSRRTSSPLIAGAEKL